MPKLHSGDELGVGIEFSILVDSQFAQNMETDLRQVLRDSGLDERMRIESS